METNRAALELDAARSLWRCVGRERELAVLDGLVEATLSDGRGRIAWICGPPGIGKSRVVEELARRVSTRGLLAIEGRCGEGGAPVATLLLGLAAALPERGLPGQAAEATRLAAALRTASLGQDCAPTPLTAGEGREPSDALDDRRHHALFERTAALLTAVAQAAPLCLVLHDLHSADGMTRALVRHLAHTRLATTELDAPPDDRLRGLLCITSREPPAEWLEGTAATTLLLGALDDTGVREFLISPEVVRLVTESTGGRPRALEALLELAPGEGDRQRAQQLAALPADARRLLDTLAVLGRPAAAARLAHLGGLGGPSALPVDPVGRAGAALDQLAQGRWTVERLCDGEVQVAFARAEAEELVRGALDEAHARELHLSIGRALLAQGLVDDADTAEHLLAGGDGEAAVQVTLAAGARLEAALGHERAVRLYRAAHRLTRRDDLRATLEARLVELQRQIGDYQGALADAQRLLDRTPDDTATLRAIGQLYLLADDYPEARRTLARARESALRSSDQDELARVIAAFAEVCLLDGRHEDATAECEVGLLATRGHSGQETVRLRLEIRNTLGKVHLAEGRYRDAEGLFADNLEEARAHAVTFEEARAYINQGIARQWLGAHEEAAACYQAALKISTGTADHRHRAFSLQNLGVLALWRSDYGTALRYFHEAVFAFKRIGQRERLSWIALDLAALYLELGAVDRAAAMSALAERFAQPRSGATVRHKRAVISARLARAAGDFDAARALLDEARQAAAATAPELHAEATAFGGWVELDAGDPAAAARVLIGAEPVLRARPPSLAARARLALLDGEIRLALGDAQLARRAVLEAVDSFQRLGDLDGEWRAHFALGRVAAAAGDQAEAERRFRRASQIDARLVERVPEELRREMSDDPSRRALARSLAQVDAAAPPPRPPAPTGERRRHVAPPMAPGGDRFERIIGRHPRMRQVYALVDKVARSQSVILIRGESGTGKELVAEAIHARSTRSAAALVKVNCSALVETLLLSELFGHERGAFTGAVQRKKGRFEAADGGTIFLDEIGDISPRTQAALLRVIQEREFERVGSTVPIKIDVRIVCATNRDLEAMVARGEFREDLYYRLKGIEVDLPPLRERPEDIPLIAADILGRVADERGEGPRAFAPEALDRLVHHRWPGNVRELDNVIRSVTLFCEGPIVTLADMREQIPAVGVGTAGPSPVGAWSPSLQGAVRELEGAAWQRIGSGGMGLRELQEKIEIECITRALAESGGNITRAAEILKMKRPRLSQLVKEHGIALPRDEGTPCVES